jgi:hypothetical protein
MIITSLQKKIQKKLNNKYRNDALTNLAFLLKRKRLISKYYNLKKYNILDYYIWEIIHLISIFSLLKNGKPLLKNWISELNTKELVQLNLILCTNKIDAKIIHLQELINMKISELSFYTINEYISILNQIENNYFTYQDTFNINQKLNVYDWELISEHYAEKGIIQKKIIEDKIYFYKENINVDK